MSAHIRLRRAYDAPAPDDGYRVLVDRLWPRGVSKEQARIDQWARDLAPSDELRRWFAHDPERWTQFQRRYREELRGREEALDDLGARASQGRLTLVYGARDEHRNNAVVLRDVVMQRSS